MRTHKFDYRKEADRLLSHKSVNQAKVLFELMGERKVVLQIRPEVIDVMNETSILRTVAGSIRHQGLNVSFPRIIELCKGEDTPHNDAETFIVRYKRALSLIQSGELTHENMLDDIVRLHNCLYYDNLDSLQYQWRVHDTPYRQLTDKREYEFTLPSHELVPGLMENMCSDYQEVMEEGIVNPFYIMPVLTMDMFIIQPFNRRYYEMSRLLISYISNWAGFEVIDQISIEHCIYRVRDQLYDSMLSASEGWIEGKNNYQKFYEIWVAVVQEVYESFNDFGVEQLHTQKSVKEIVLLIMRKNGGSMTKRMIMENTPYHGESSIEQALYGLSKEGTIKKVGGGRYSEYILNEQA